MFGICPAAAPRSCPPFAFALSSSLSTIVVPAVAALRILQEQIQHPKMRVLALLFSFLAASQVELSPVAAVPNSELVSPNNAARSLQERATLEFCACIDAQLVVRNVPILGNVVVGRITASLCVYVFQSMLTLCLSTRLTRFLAILQVYDHHLCQLEPDLRRCRQTRRHPTHHRSNRPTHSLPRASMLLPRLRYRYSYLCGRLYLPMSVRLRETER